MASDFQEALKLIEQQAASKFEKGKAFERLTRVLLENDRTQRQYFSKVWEWPAWANDREGFNTADTGIDLVAQLRDGSGYCAVQCKNYKSNNRIAKKSLDSFISAAASSEFKLLMLVDTSTQPLGNNAKATVANLDKDFIRLPLDAFEESLINWQKCVEQSVIELKRPKTPKPHQKDAVKDVSAGFAEHDRGKVIMACGTGKTFASLLIAEKLAGAGKHVLYLVPSLALMQQTVLAWKNDSTDEFTAFAACSDEKVGERDDVIIKVSDLAFPATTNATELAQKVTKASKDQMTVVFSTYQSIDVIQQAQKECGLPVFDLIICDEAHRTTGETLENEEESSFVKIHDNANVEGRKRLYMTATLRVYGEDAKNKAKSQSIVLADMNDQEKYGPVFFSRSFGWAVEKDLLSDYKVIVLAVDEALVSKHANVLLSDDSELQLNEASQIVGCYKALVKVGLEEQLSKEAASEPMRTAISFCANIKKSKLFEAAFAKVVAEYLTNEEQSLGIKDPRLNVKVKHVDGTYNAKMRSERLAWLQEDTQDEANEKTCRILTNARCLSEGVDVPALDAIIFFHPRKSVIDVVQSVGRIMRKAPGSGKKFGYVILPVAIPSSIPAEEALNDNKRYKVVWQTLNALRSHDTRFDTIVNSIRLGEDVSEKLIIQVVSDVRGSKPGAVKAQEEDAAETVPPSDTSDNLEQQQSDLFPIVEALKARIVEKCGTRVYWDKWAEDVGLMAEAHITRITTLVERTGSEEAKCFEKFLLEIQDNLNPSITRQEAIEMLAQHLITKPVFDSLFPNRAFTEQNSVSQALDKVLQQLHEKNIQKEAADLEGFYAYVKKRAEGIKGSEGRQQLIVTLYDKFFRSAFPRLVEKLGIVYTPIEVVDFIIRSVNDVLEDEFKSSLGSENVNIIDPFAGTGNFITRLLQSGLIPKEKLAHKYAKELHANEIVLLAYYIAAINIESAYQEGAADKSYAPFKGMVLTDTFQLYEEGKDMVAELLPDNSNRRASQRNLDIMVVIGNPPYSKGQKSQNDNAANISYPNLDKSIQDTYVDRSSATSKISLYDSYVRALRLASDQIKERGIIGFVTNAGWLDSKSGSGIRACMEDEFSKIYIFHLRGNTRTSGETAKKEGGKIFGAGSRASIAITILVKNPGHSGKAKIHYHDIGDYLGRQEKLSIIEGLSSIGGIASKKSWDIIEPDSLGTWINQGEKSYAELLPLSFKKNPGAEACLFKLSSNGITTKRDSWCHNSSAELLLANMKNMIAFYELERKRHGESDKKIRFKDFADMNPRKISWSKLLLTDAEKDRPIQLDDKAVRLSSYRPFFKQHLYFAKKLNEDQSQIPKLFPTGGNDENRVICTTGAAASAGFSALITDSTPDLHFMGGFVYPLSLHDTRSTDSLQLESQKGESSVTGKSGISDHGRNSFKKAYPGENFSREDLFYYTYGIFHHAKYKSIYGNNLRRERPRIPIVKKYRDFRTISEKGRLLAELHINYEDAPIYEGCFSKSLIGDDNFHRVSKMKFASRQDKSKVKYNENITLENIPLRAYDYVVNGRSALEWVMDRQRDTTNKESGLRNDCNDFKGTRYPLELFLRMITVSLRTLGLVDDLSKADIKDFV